MFHRCCKKQQSVESYEYTTGMLLKTVDFLVHTVLAVWESWLEPRQWHFFFLVLHREQGLCCAVGLHFILKFSGLPSCSYPILA